MKKIIPLFLLLMAFAKVQGQRIESIHFNLYTDSLKKGTYNYINVDGKMSDGNWMPLTDKQLTFSADYGRFDGNNLILPENPSVKKVTVTINVKGDTKRTEKTTIWIKQKPDPQLPINDKGEINLRRRH